MRKQQIALLENAKQNGQFSKSQIDTLSREDWHMDILRAIHRYFYWQNHLGKDKELTSADANKWVDFLIAKKKLGKFTHKEDFFWVFNRFFPTGKYEDIFLGDNRKIYFYDVYRFIEKKKTEFFASHETSIREQNDIEEDTIHIYMLFCHLFERNVPIKTIKQIVKFSAQLHNRAHEMRRMFDKFPVLYDDCVSNGDASLIFYLMQNMIHIYEDFEPSESSLNQLYDFNNHKFIFDFEDFRKYFVYESDSYCNTRYRVSEEALLLIAKEKYPIIDAIYNFCKNNKFNKSQHDKYNNIFGNWSQWGLWDPTQTPKLLECHKILGKPFKTDIGAWSMHIEISQNYFISIAYHEYKTIVVTGKRNLPYESSPNGWTAEKPQYIAKLLITPDGKVFRTYGEVNKKRNIPFAFKDFFYFNSKPNSMRYFVKTIIDFHKTTSPFVGDLFDDCKNYGCLLPINFNDTIGYHNRSHFIKEKYKTSNGLNVNWNKINVNLSYLIIKAQTWVDTGTSKQILLQQKSSSLIPDAQYRRGSEEKIAEFLVNVICNKIIESHRQEHERKVAKFKRDCHQELYSEVSTTILPDELTAWTNDRVNDMTNQFELRHTVNDYIHMCRRTKAKIRLDVRSIEQLENLHDGLAFRGSYQRTRTGAVKIPKKSQFNQLRKILPDEFEWIKTRKRLILETELQHHCVWSYADKITADNCAIYSFVDNEGKFANDGKPKRYTIEFMADKNGKYRIVQVQGQYDRINTKIMRDHIQEILNNAQKSEEK